MKPSGTTQRNEEVIENKTVDLSRTPSEPTAVEIANAMVKVSEAMGEPWTATRLGAQYYFAKPNGKRPSSRRRDFRDAVAEVTGLTVIK